MKQFMINLKGKLHLKDLLLQLQTVWTVQQHWLSQSLRIPSLAVVTNGGGRMHK